MFTTDLGAGRSVEREAILPPAAVDIPARGKGKYVYCVIRSSKPLQFGMSAIAGELANVHTVNYKDLAAVVSDVPIGPLDSTRENVLAHEHVNETVMREHTVIPMSFGTIFKTREDALELLRSAHDAFDDVLSKMANKLEFGLKVLWDRDAVIAEIEKEDEDIRRLRNEIASQKGSTYFAAHAVWAPARGGAPEPVGALRVRDPRRSARVGGGCAHQQADRRQDDPQRRVPRVAGQRGRVRSVHQARGRSARKADVQVHWAVAAVQFRQHPPEARAGLGVAVRESVTCSSSTRC